MNDNKKISVLMSTYKNDDAIYLKESIDSILNQTLRPDEIVIVIDGAIPKVNMDILLDYSRNNSLIKLIKLKKNVGLGLALNRGVKECKNELIARMDSDDIADTNRLKLQYDAINKYDCDIVGGNISEFVGDKKNIVSYRIVPELDENIKKYMKQRCPMNHVTVMFRKKSVLEAGNYMSWHYNEDYILWIKMFENGCKFYNIQKNLVNVRVGEEMYKRRGGLKYFKSEQNIQKYMLKNNIINYPTYLINIIKRFLLQVVLSNNMRQFVFKNFARKKV